MDIDDEKYNNLKIKHIEDIIYSYNNKFDNLTNSLIRVKMFLEETIKDNLLEKIENMDSEQSKQIVKIDNITENIIEIKKEIKEIDRIVSKVSFLNKTLTTLESEYDTFKEKSLKLLNNKVLCDNKFEDIEEALELMTGELDKLKSNMLFFKNTRLIIKYGSLALIGLYSCLRFIFFLKDKGFFDINYTM